MRFADLLLFLNVVVAALNFLKRGLDYVAGAPAVTDLASVSSLVRTVSDDAERLPARRKAVTELRDHAADNPAVGCV